MNRPSHGPPHHSLPPNGPPPQNWWPSTPPSFKTPPPMTNNGIHPPSCFPPVDSAQAARLPVGQPVSRRCRNLYIEIVGKEVFTQCPPGATLKENNSTLYLVDHVKRQATPFKPDASGGSLAEENEANLREIGRLRRLVDGNRLCMNRQLQAIKQLTLRLNRQAQQQRMTPLYAMSEMVAQRGELALNLSSDRHLLSLVAQTLRLPHTSVALQLNENQRRELQQSTPALFAEYCKREKRIREHGCEQPSAGDSQVQSSSASSTPFGVDNTLTAEQSSAPKSVEEESIVEDAQMESNEGQGLFNDDLLESASSKEGLFQEDERESNEPSVAPQTTGAPVHTTVSERTAISIQTVPRSVSPYIAIDPEQAASRDWSQSASPPPHPRASASVAQANRNSQERSHSLSRAQPAETNFAERPSETTTEEGESRSHSSLRNEYAIPSGSWGPNAVAFCPSCQLYLPLDEHVLRHHMESAHHHDHHQGLVPFPSGRCAVIDDNAAPTPVPASFTHKPLVTPVDREKLLRVRNIFGSTFDLVATQCSTCKMSLGIDKYLEHEHTKVTQD